MPTGIFILTLLGPPPVSFSSFPLQSYSSNKASFQSPMSYGGSSSPYLFWICKINNRITTCFGCRGKFTLDFSVGYFEGSQQTKIWLVGTEDLKTMYQKYPSGGSITLWCDARCEESTSEGGCKRKRDNDAPKKQSNTIEENECEVDLLDKHDSKWDTPRLRLWARCIVTEMHESYVDPPAFKAPEPKRRKESLTEALSGAAVAFAGVISKQQAPPVQEGEHSGTPRSCSGQGVSSPRKIVELRLKNYEQLRYF